MPTNKDPKRLIRERMQNTGESYTVARVHVLSGSLPPPADYERVAGMSDEAVVRSTGKSWRTWTELLDAEDAASLAHADIVQHVVRIMGPEASGWWAQTVTVAYERFRGLRDVGQRRSGEFEVGKSRTFPVPVAALYEAFVDPVARRSWLDDPSFEITTANRNKGVRARLGDDTRVEVYFTAKGDARSAVSVQHRKLADRGTADVMKEVWAGRLDALGRTLEK